MALVKGTNSYVTVAEANAYFEDRIGAEQWAAAPAGVREKALVTATGQLDELQWLGTAVSESQPLAFPRNGSYFESRLGLQVELDPAQTPSRIVTATYELALHLLSNTDVLSSAGDIKNLTVGSIKLEGLNSVPTMPSTVKRLYKSLINANGGGSGGAWWRAN